MRYILPVIIFSLSLLGFKSSVAQESEVYQAITNSEQLTKLADLCPSKLVQAEDIDFENLTDTCADNQMSCLNKCMKGSSNHCFGLANHFNITDENSYSYSRPLYAKSCQLGLASSCTNVGAGIKNNLGLDEALCYTKTFKKTCELDDPWGCTMYAVSLIYGEGTKKDLDKALSVMRGSCRFGETDRACSTALDLASEILMGEFNSD
jgi:TPR repeat protein